MFESCIMKLPTDPKNMKLPTDPKNNSFSEGQNSRVQKIFFILTKLSNCDRNLGV